MVGCVRGWREALERITLMFTVIQILYLFDRYSPTSGSLSSRPNALDLVEA